MTEQHRAKPEVWARVESYGSKDEKDMLNCVLEHMLNCVLELRDRVEALEAAQRVESNYPEKPDSSNAPESSDSLVKRVADAINSTWPRGVREEACAAIHTIADWLDQQDLHTTAARLRQEVG